MAGTRSAQLVARSPWARYDSRVRTSILLAAFLIGCSSFSKEDPPPVEVMACEEADGIRVHFFLRDGEVSAADVKFKADAGDLIEITRSQDLRRVSALWRDGDGLLTCTFPYGQVGEFNYTDEVLEHKFLYVFHQGTNAIVTALVPRGSPVRPRLLLTIDVKKDALPATMQWEGREVRDLTRERSLILVELPRSEKGVLKTGDWKVTLKTAKDKDTFLIGLDPDGTPTASSGFVKVMR